MGAARKGRFLDLRDPTKHAAFATVRNLVAEYDEDVVRRAFAEVVAAGKLRRWVKGYRLTEAKGKACAFRTTSGCIGAGCPGCDVPCAENQTLWSRGRKPVVYVMQPFGLSVEGFNRLAAWCSERDFDCRIDAASSWHFPGGSLFVAIAPRGGSFWSLEWTPPGRKSVWGAKP